jgi:hypothetical protein
VANVLYGISLEFADTLKMFSAVLMVSEFHISAISDRTLRILISCCTLFGRTPDALLLVPRDGLLSYVSNRPILQPPARVVRSVLTLAIVRTIVRTGTLYGVLCCFSTPRGGAGVQIGPRLLTKYGEVRRRGLYIGPFPPSLISCTDSRNATVSGITATIRHRIGAGQGEWRNFWAVVNGENFGKTFGATHRVAAKMS